LPARIAAFSIKMEEETCTCGHWKGYHCGVGQYAGNCIVKGCGCKKFEKKSEEEDDFWENFGSTAPIGLM